MNFVLAFVAILVLGSAIMLVLALPAIFSSADNSVRVREGNEIAACRSNFRVGIDDALGRVMLAFGDGLAAVAEDDDPSLDAAIGRLRRAETDLQESTQAYVEASDAAVQRPQEFLEECRRRHGGS